MTRILVTRPEGQNQALLDALQAQGYNAVALPMLAIVPLLPETDEQACLNIVCQVQQLDRYQHVIFVSTNAVHRAFDWIHQYWPVLPENINWYPIGAATAAALAQYVDHVQQAGVNMDSETLLQHPQLQQPQQQRVLIFRGQGGRHFLHDTLTERGASVDFCELYQRRFKRYNDGTLRQILAQPVDFLLAGSTETIQALLEQAIIEKLEQAVLNIRLIVPGQRVARFAKAQGFARVIASDNAGLAATMDVLRTHNN